ncbi:TetR/AcrR family transcriptional regulator C-terminal domain-containing protein [Paracoccus kondratievae]
MSVCASFGSAWPRPNGFLACAGILRSGPALLRQQLVKYLDRCVQRGELRIPDLELAANQLIELAGTAIHDRALFLGPQSVDRELVRKVNRGAVTMFLACYGSGKSSLMEAAE